MNKRPSHKGKRVIERKINYKKILLSILIIVLIICAFYLFLQNKNKSVKTNLETPNIETKVAQTEETEKESDEIIDTSYLPDKLGNYSVIGELVIDKIDVKKSILEKTENASLDLSVTKFYGPNINEVGNFCITGHNYKNLLKRLGELEENDTFYLINKTTGTKVTYQIYDIYTCKPNEVECLYQPTENVREVTLITCNPGGVTRLICKAKEI